MLPARVKVVSSSPCSLSEASRLLQRFLSDDAASDSYARSYLETVALALDESRSSAAESSMPLASSSDFREGKRQHLIGSSDAAQTLAEGQGSPNLLEMERFSRSEGKKFKSSLHSGRKEKADKKHREKRRHYNVDMGSEFRSPSEEDVALPLKDVEDMRSMKKKKKHAEKRRHSSVHQGSEFRLPSEEPLPLKDLEGIWSMEKKKKHAEKGRHSTDDMGSPSEEPVALPSKEEDMRPMKKKTKEKKGKEHAALFSRIECTMRC